MRSLANLPVEIWEHIIDDIVGPANPTPDSEFPWIYSLRSESCILAARKQRLQKLQLLSAVARTWRELCLILSYETFLLGDIYPIRLRWLLKTQLPRFPSLFRRTRRLFVVFRCLEDSRSIALFVELVEKMPVLQDLTSHVLPFHSEHHQLVERGILDALRPIGSKLLFLQLQQSLLRDLNYERILTGQSVKVLSALAPNLTRLICAIEVDKPSSSEPAPSFPNLQILHMQLHADRFEQDSVHSWLHRWQLGALKQFGARDGLSIPLSEWVPMLLRGNNGRNLEVFEIEIGLNLSPVIPPVIWTQCPNLHTLTGFGLQWVRLNLPPTHRPLKALVYQESGITLLQYDSSQPHFVRELRDIDFAAHTTITFSEQTWEEFLRYAERHTLTYLANNMVNAGMNAGLRLVDANEEVVDEYLARTGVTSDVL